MTERAIRQWQPGDGLRCSYSKHSPIPCGQPVKTRVIVADHSAGGRRSSTRTQPLCPVHALSAECGGGFSAIAEAHRIAMERVVAEHYVDFQRYIAEAVQSLTSNLNMEH